MIASVCPVCPVCQSSQLLSSVRRSALPAMQNHLYASLEAALAAARGAFELAVCTRCGVGHNRLFDASLVTYDASYDNSVPSRVMDAYYRQLAAHLCGAYDLEGRLVVDVGCGKGTFLQVLCESFASVRGLGIDPSHAGPRTPSNRLRFIADVFAPEQLDERPALVLCRHVLEHLPAPLGFLAAVAAALDAHPATPATPLFVEVPDVRWIVEQGAYWDLCYEHCNYFDGESLGALLAQAGFALLGPPRHAFGGQYLWAEASRAPAERPAASERRPSIVDAIIDYHTTETEQIARTRARLRQLVDDGFSLAVWGMATKGIVFANLVDPRRSLLRLCVDVNPTRQGCFVPLTGHEIAAPRQLADGGSGKWAIIVMNPNYLEEIRQTCADLGLAPLFVDASGAPHEPGAQSGWSR